MGTNANKRARQREQRNRLADARQELDLKARRRRQLSVVAALVVVAVAIALVVVLTGGDTDTADSGTERTGEADAPLADDALPDDPLPDDPLSDDAASVELPEPPPGITLTGDTPCPAPEGSPERVQVFAGPPPDCLTPGATYSATISTTEGDFTAELAVEEAPVAVNNFVVLSRYRYFEGVPFHRIVPDFVIQAGDGDGAPWGNNDLGYSFEDELPDSSAAYTDHSLAMANAGPNTNGSQFFVVLPGGGAQLQPLYTYFGQVTDGTDVVDAIGELGNFAQEPTRVVLINSVEIHETD